MHGHGGAARHGSTLRLTLGCLLAQELSIELRRVGSGNRMTFGPGEHRFSEWLSENALVSWLACGRPWRLKINRFPRLSLPLNLRRNHGHAFHARLARFGRLRRSARGHCRYYVNAKVPISSALVGSAAHRLRRRPYVGLRVHSVQIYRMIRAMFVMVDKRTHLQGVTAHRPEHRP
ncbi:MAG: GIY-YIG nuclease family protein [Bryobacteraceae bacterium]